MTQLQQNNGFLPVSRPTITKKEIEYVTAAIASGWVSSLGEYITAFEEKFAEFCGTKYALTCSNGTTSLHLALVTMGISVGDEIIMPDLTFIATANAAKYVGAVPVLVDIERDTLCIDPAAIEAAITEKTKAIMPVHLYGHPANMPAIMAIAEKYNLLVIEDAAEAHGAEVNGKRVGSWGHCGSFSFYGNKVITSGEGGMITTDDEALYTRAKYLRDHAMSPTKRYWHTEVGFNYRMTNLQAALGLAQLERIDEILAKKQEAFEWYEAGLAGIDGISLNRTAPWAKNVYWMVTLEIAGIDEAQRDIFMKKLREFDVDSRPYFYPLSEMAEYPGTHTPVTYAVYQTGINLPSYFDMEKRDVERVCAAVRKCMEMFQ
ncbi:DegT/DnrJ/EryC1/StrS family aminotransferase [Thiothrix fructosivorans]|jgi:perosamine synthetase|uniref:GDP-perosamine synthase n=1 Tax=Thiothrix fructosivorans TaxID=111770 RepID=A0A8B0SJS7_9GAMM|nr:DegT/DnrJ/EryC1/StrS family aminotransferase [Thiothrix fructosivorans]MBO0612026.1 DegT/DnrJ/EryC1/StrS family aminotransferase [Thiothrix fructosivorans]QTX12473.1 DegT/DnrJ/EryC1/StrS family aminotransferase [Thiothrix fructosivorans]